MTPLALMSMGSKERELIFCYMKSILTSEANAIAGS